MGQGISEVLTYAVAVAISLLSMVAVVYRPWIPEPGMWAQWDWGKGPIIAGRATNLFCAWFGWSRFRVVIPTWDRTMPTVIGCLDRAMRAAGGAPTYWLTDNEKTVTVDHVAGIAVRNPAIVAAGHHYGVTITRGRWLNRRSNARHNSGSGIASHSSIGTSTGEQPYR